MPDFPARLLEHVMAPSATVYERTLGEEARRLFELDVERIRTLSDPDGIPADLLPFLAWSLSVDLWDQDWPEWKRRNVTRQALPLHALKGTLRGIEAHVDIAGGTLIQYIVPPGGWFASRDLTKAEWDAYIDQHPKARITFATRDGEWIAPHGHFAGETFADEDFVAPDDGRSLRGRLAFLRMHKGAQEIPLQMLRTSQVTATLDAAVYETLVVPAPDPLGWYAGDAFCDDAFTSVDDIAQRSYSFRIDRQYQHATSRFWLDTVPLGYYPRDTRFRRESDIGDAGADIFADDTLAGNEFATRDRADLLLADVLYLHNPAVAVPVTEGISFAGDGRVGVRNYTAEMLIDVEHYAHADECFAGEVVVHEVFARADDTRHIVRVLDAIAVSQAARDRVLTTFQTTRHRTLGDGYLLDGSVTFGGRVRNTL